MKRFINARQKEYYDRRVRFNTSPGTPTLRRSFMAIRLPALPTERRPVSDPEQYSDLADRITRSFKSVAPTMPCRMFNIPGSVGIRFNVNACSIMFGNVQYAGADIVTLARLADAAAYRFRHYKARMSVRSRPYSFSEELAKSDSEFPAVVEALNAFEKSFTACGIIGDIGDIGEVKPVDAKRTDILERCVNALDSVVKKLEADLLALNQRMEDLNKRGGVFESDLLVLIQQMQDLNKRAEVLLGALHKPQDLTPLPGSVGGGVTWGKF